MKNDLETKAIKAIIIEGTGGVGAFLVQKLLASSKYAKVTVISRNKILEHPKLNTIIWKDFSKNFLEKKEESVEIFKDHDVLFCCLGAPEKALLGLFFNRKKYAALFQKVDYDYTVAAAKIGYKAGIPNFSVISSPSAKPSAKFIYSKIKWNMEQAIKNNGFKKVSIFHPYHLMKPANNQANFLKKITKNFVALIASILPAKQKAIKVEDVAKAMMLEFELGLQKGDGLTYYTSNNMRGIIKKARISEKLPDDTKQF